MYLDFISNLDRLIAKIEKAYFKSETIYGLLKQPSKYISNILLIETVELYTLIQNAEDHYEENDVLSHYLIEDYFYKQEKFYHLTKDSHRKEDFSHAYLEQSFQEITESYKAVQELKD